jgi:hypothetical protein
MVEPEHCKEKTDSLPVLPFPHAKIVSESWVTIEREIIIENWATDDAWNRQRKLIHGGRMKSV